MLRPSRRIRQLAIVGAAAASIALASAAQATTVLTTFDNFNLSGTYAAWSGATLTSGPTSYRVQAPGGFGGGYFDMDPNINAAGETTIELTYTGNPDNLPNGIVLVLVDEDITQYNYVWYGLSNGTNTLTASINAPSFISNGGGTPGLDLSQLSFFHIQVDTPGITDISWEHLQLTPEPASLALLGLGGIAIMRRRRATK